jgi:uncharacterized protein (DUF58 family)
MRKALLAAAGLAILGVGALAGADPNWLFLAGLASVGATVAAAGSWCTAVGLAGGETTPPDGCARYGAGSLVNTFVPARAGDAVRVALFSKLVRHDGRIRSTVGRSSSSPPSISQGFSPSRRATSASPPARSPSR